MTMQWVIGVLLACRSTPLIAQIQPFTFAGVGLQSDFKVVAARYPHSSPQDQYVSLDPLDVHDHISAIEVSGAGPTRRVRIAFETHPAGKAPDSAIRPTILVENPARLYGFGPSRP